MSSTIDQIIIEDFRNEYKLDMIDSTDDAVIENSIEAAEEKYHETVKYKLFDEPLMG